MPVALTVSASPCGSGDGPRANDNSILVVVVAEHTGRAQSTDLGDIPGLDFRGVNSTA